MRTTLPKFIAQLSTGLLSGAFLYGLINLVPAFYEVPMNVHLIFRTTLMNHNGITMQLLMAISILTPVWYAVVNRRNRRVMILSLVSASMALTALLVTRFGNVPINLGMRTWSEQDLPDNWAYQLQIWDLYNTIRCIAAILSFLFIMAGAHSYEKTMYKEIKIN